MGPLVAAKPLRASPLNGVHRPPRRHSALLTWQLACWFCGQRRETMARLPEIAEQRHLLEGLRKLIAERGARHLLSAPIVEPSVRFFPDRQVPDAGGVAAIAYRLLSYAGLEGLQVSVVEFADDPDMQAWCQGQGSGIAACFAGIEDGVC